MWGGGDDSREQEVCRQGSTQLLLRAVRQKPLPEQVTLAQWISDNARIMAKLIREGRMSGQEEILSYLQYTMDIGDYAQVCHVGSVMVYDNEYRKKQWSKGRKWGDDDVHLATFYLQRKQANMQGSRINTNTKAMSNQRMAPPRTLDTHGNEICRNYNFGACYRPQCQFAHSCIVCKARGHSKSSHRDRPAVGQNVLENTV